MFEIISRFIILMKHYIYIYIYDNFIHNTLIFDTKLNVLFNLCEIVKVIYNLE